MTHLRFVAAAFISVLAASCASTPHEPASSANSRAEPSHSATSRDAIVGTPVPGSGFSKLTIGMDMQATQDVMGRAPDKLNTFESGKRWIPFYFGSDARRMQVLYRGQGCLTFTGGNVWGGGGGELVLIEVDSSGSCYQP
jgi:hypothetical protein